VPVCAKCGQENPEVARFCLACGAPLAAEPAPPTEERRLVTVLFTDIVGSTAKAEQMDPENVRARLAPYYTRLRTELERFGGTVEKFIGDAVVALFGAPVAHEDDPERAVRAAFAVCRAIAELNEEDEWLDLQVRVGVNTGEALVVLDANPTEGEGMASGDVMNTAARLQSAAPVNGILVGELTYFATRDKIEYGDAEPIAAKGKAQPLPVWEAIAPRDESRLKTGARTPLIGRTREVDELTEQWSRVVRERRPATAVVLGPPGIGKSRLIAELGRKVEQEGNAHWGRCLSYGEGITYWPVTELVKSAAGIMQSDPAQTVAAKLDEFLASLRTEDIDELRTIAAALSNILGSATTPRGTYATTQISRAELHWGIRRAFQLLSLDRPTMLVFEDLHWAEPTLLELITFIAADDIEAPLLVVGSARPELAEAAPAHVATTARRRTIALDTLTAEAGTALVAELLGDASLAATPVAATLIRNAGGNPLFLEESVRMLRDRDLIDAEQWRSEEAPDLPIPTSLQSLIGARLDQLATDEKRCAHTASVIGSVFWAGAVAHLGVDGDGAPVDPRDQLGALVHRDFIRRTTVSTIADEEEFAFKHILIRDVAYGQLPKGRRAQLHVRFADWVTILPGSADEFVEIVAWHLEQACRLSREVVRSPIEPPVLAAAGALANAARRAEQREGMGEAVRYYERALDLLGEDYPEQSLELRLPLARAHGALGELGLAGEQLDAVAADAVAFERSDLRSMALITLGNIDHRQGRPSDARGRLSEAATLARQTGDRSLQVRATFGLAAVRADYEGDAPSAADDLRQAVSVAEEMDDRALRLEGHLRLGFLLHNMGAIAASEQELHRCLQLAGELGSLRDEARATFLLGLAKHYRGEPQEAERLNLQAREWLERTGERYFQMQNFRALGLYALARNDVHAAEHWLREAIPVAVEEGGRYVLEVYRFLAETLVRQDRIGDAATLVEFAAREVPVEDVVAQAYVLLARAAVAAAERDRDALTLYRDAVERLEEQLLPLEAADARVTFAGALRRFGELDEARAQLVSAREAFTRMDAVGPCREIDAELEEIAGGAGRPGPAR
jgi:class 3 adenylate cyclase/tetratricopeptide (TPR) repeat protein